MPNSRTALPPLPRADFYVSSAVPEDTPAYTDDQMRSYALSAIDQALASTLVAAPLSDTDMARIYRRVTGGNRFDSSAIALMREVERAAVEAMVAAPAASTLVEAAGEWVMVPREATPVMCAAAAKTPGMKAIDDSSGIMQARGYPLDPAAFEDGSALAQAWRAMLAAASAPPVLAPAEASPRLVQRLVNATCTQEVAPSEEHQNEYRAARDAVEAALAATPSPPQAPQAETVSDERLDEIAHAHRWDTSAGRRSMMRRAIEISATPSATAQADWQAAYAEKQQDLVRMIEENESLRALLATARLAATAQAAPLAPAASAVKHGDERVIAMTDGYRLRRPIGQFQHWRLEKDGEEIRRLSRFEAEFVDAALAAVAQPSAQAAQAKGD